jgi:hypothetical protein
MAPMDVSLFVIGGYVYIAVSSLEFGKLFGSVNPGRTRYPECSGFDARSDGVTLEKQIGDSDFAGV